MIEIIYKGGFAMVPLIASSLVAVTVILERSWFWLRRRGAPMNAEVFRHASAGEYTSALRRLEERDTPANRVLAAGLTSPDRPAEAMEGAILAEASSAKRFLPALDTIITLAPLLGLFGTIVGMIRSFGIMSATGISQPHAVTGGIAEALIATATGLIVAVVSLVPYNYFQARVEREMESLEILATRLEASLPENGARVAGGSGKGERERNALATVS
ncbi:MAG: hypothetical protein A2V83_00090 [Nitrospirae bacterium RBG_16_64_22]|nr:MAG: hypothetical protein A2V83_00090 [Nitrospirae bacterium RBG_16_64_22]